MKQEPEIVVIGEECKELVPIEIVFIIPKGKVSTNRIQVTTFMETPQRVELIAKDYEEDYDLIFAIPLYKKRSQGCLYLGHWNDGILKS